MRKSLAARLAVLAAGATVLLGAGGLALAQAGQTDRTEQAPMVVPLQEDHQNTTAAEFQPEDQECEGPFANLDENQDGWHFVLTQFDGDTDDVEFVLQFRDTQGNQVEITENATNVTGGVAHLWLVTPAGWTLLNGVAIVTPPGSVGNNPQFNLSHTCPGVPETPTPTPSESPTPPPATESPTPPPATESPTPPPATESPTPPPATESPTPPPATESPAPSPSYPPGYGGELPTTGNPVAALAVLGVGLLGTGLASFKVRRRRGLTAS